MGKNRGNADKTASLKHLQGKVNSKSQKQKSQSRTHNKSKERKWVDVKIEELDACFTELRKTTTSNKDSNSNTGMNVCSNVSTTILNPVTPALETRSRSLSEPMSFGSSVMNTDASAVGKGQQSKKEEYLMPVVDGTW